LVAAVRRALERGQTPIVQAYALGKAQEATKILTSAGIPVLQEREIFNLSRVYESCGVSLGDHVQYPDYWRHGTAIVIPPSRHKATTLKKVKSPWMIACTGWALDADLSRRWGVDEAVALTDHADYGQLWTLIERVKPKKVFCFHGPDEFVDRLREQGVEAYSLYAPTTWK
ncbi:MAG TPA: MBL fold metallo-hydrolase RNA specificity domain-containing protein, partial [Pirellulales bacterium]